MSTLAIYNAAGKKVKALAVPVSIEKATWSPDLVHQIAVTQQGSPRGLAKVKNRAEVRGGGQNRGSKGTGRARHDPFARQFGQEEESHTDQPARKSLREK